MGLLKVNDTRKVCEFKIFLHLNEQIKSVWVDLDWVDVRCAWLSPLSQHNNLENYYVCKLNFVCCHLFQFSMYVLCNAGVSSKHSMVNHRQHQNRLK